MMVVLETLSPAERVAFVLHDMFGVPFSEIGEISGRSAGRGPAAREPRPPAVRGSVPPPDPDLDEQRQVVDAFLAAARAGDFEALLDVLDPNVVQRIHTAEGDRRWAPTAVGAEKVAKRALARGGPFAPYGRPAVINGNMGAVVVIEGKRIARERHDHHRRQDHDDGHLRRSARRARNPAALPGAGVREGQSQGKDSVMQGVWVVASKAGIAVAGALACLVARPDRRYGGASAAVGSTDLSMTKADTADPVTVGDTFGYVLTVKNEGANDAGDVITTDNLPSQVSYVSATPSAGTCQKSGSKITCDLGQVNSAASASVTITVKASKSGTASNTASLTSSDDTNATNNLDTETTVINKKPSTPKPKKPKGQPSCAAPTIVGTPATTSFRGPPART